MERSTASKTRYFTRIDQLEHLNEQEKVELKKVADKFAFRCNDYYLSLIDWDDPNDPIRRIIIPNMRELKEWGRLDPSDERIYTVIPGLEHKYNSTVLMLVSNVCGGICRYCFRKRVFINSQQDYLHDLPAAVSYLRDHTEITNVLLTGGDPLVLTSSQLENIIRGVTEIEHIRIIRIGTRIPAFDPYRIIDDPALVEMLGAYSMERRKIYVMTHFIHPRELTDPAIKAINLLQKAGVEVVLAELLAELSFIGAIPYYIFQCRPASGNKTYTVPIETGYEIVEQAKARVSGLAKRVRFVMSHSTGKIEIVGKTKDRVYFKYHRAALDQDSGRFLVFRSNPVACWFDDYDEIIQDYPINQPYRSYGPE
ncbi:MAG: KamA family radical SAM protein [Planctomycetota bacterium]